MNKKTLNRGMIKIVINIEMILYNGYNIHMCLRERKIGEG